MPSLQHLLTIAGSSIHLAAAINGTDLAFKMLDSNLARGQGCALASASTNFIELGIFQQALRQAIPLTSDPEQKETWTQCLHSGIHAAADLLSDAEEDVGYPLDRLSVGTSMLHHLFSSSDDDVQKAIKALQTSVVQQPRNANNGLWYYANPSNLTAYRNLSYADGMYSFAPFAALSTLSTLYPDPVVHPQDAEASALSLDAMWQQLDILTTICQRPSGLMLHGYDAIKAHSWASPSTGASPLVWGRAEAWFTLGVLTTIETIQTHHPEPQPAILSKLKNLLTTLLTAQIQASETSRAKTGTYGVWQIVDQPGESGNFLEASASSMTVYALLRSVRLGLLTEGLCSRGRQTALGMYAGVVEKYLIDGKNGTVSLNGTSSVASLSGDVSYEYYVTRPVEVNSLIGTSAFILASLEVGDEMAR